MISLVRKTKATRLNAKTWANKFESRLIEAGIVSYEDQDCGKALLRQETIQRCANSFVGRPLIIKHKSVNPGNMETLAGGWISDVYYNDKDGWWYAKGTVHNDAAKEAIKRDGFVSCAYKVKNSVRGGSYHNIPYNEEITDFDGEHLAIVDNPRYEGATIRLNAKQQPKHMKLFKWFKKDASKENAGAEKIAAEKAAADAAALAAAETAKLNSVGGELGEDTEIEIAEGQTVKLNDLVTAYSEANKQEEVVENSLTEDSLVEVDGKQVSVKDLVTAYNAKQEALKPAPAAAKPAAAKSVIKLARQNAGSVMPLGKKPFSQADGIARAKQLIGVSSSETK